MPGYETIPFGGATKQSVAANKSLGLATVAEKEIVDETSAQIPMSARSTLSGRSWLSESKWSDEDSDPDGVPDLPSPKFLASKSPAAVTTASNQVCFEYLQ